MANVKAPMAPVRGPVSKPAVMPANKDRYTTDMGMDEMGRMPPPVNKSPGGPSGDMAGIGRVGGNMPPPVNKSAVMPGNGMPPPVNKSAVMPVGGGAMAMGGGMGAKPVGTTGAVGWKKGGKVKTKCYAKGGSVRTSASSRGDGCATKGHTKGVMR